MAAPVLEVRDLPKTYRGDPAVAGLSFAVPEGTVTAFLGPNGAGKTTTIAMLLGLVQPDHGVAAVFGRPYGRLDRPASRVGVLIDGSAFHPQRTARNHLRVLAAASDVGRHRVEEVLDLVDLSSAADKKVGAFSLGMRQRLGLAGALLGDPDLLVLDEPANGLDPAGMRWLRLFLRDFAASGRTVFLSSHVLSEVAQSADQAVVISRGRLVQQTSMEQLTAGSAVRVRTPEPDRLRRALAGRDVVVTLEGPDRLDVLGLTVEDVGDTALRERIAVHGLSPRGRSLEDVFLDLTSTDPTSTEERHHENARQE